MVTSTCAGTAWRPEPEASRAVALGVSEIQVGGDDVGAVAGEGERDAASDAPASAGDDSHAAAYVHAGSPFEEGGWRVGLYHGRRASSFSTGTGGAMKSRYSSTDSLKATLSSSTDCPWNVTTSLVTNHPAVEDAGSSSKLTAPRYPLCSIMAFVVTYPCLFAARG